MSIISINVARFRDRGGHLIGSGLQETAAAASQQPIGNKGGQTAHRRSYTQATHNRPLTVALSFWHHYKTNRGKGWEEDMWQKGRVSKFTRTEKQGTNKTPCTSYCRCGQAATGLKLVFGCQPLQQLTTQRKWQDMRGAKRGGNFKLTFVDKFITEKLTAFRVFLPNKKNAACILQYKIICDL